MHALGAHLRTLVCNTAVIAALTPLASAQQSGSQTTLPPDSSPVRTVDGTFTLGEIVYVLGQDPRTPGIGGSVVSHEQMQTFERNSLDQAVNLVPGVVANLDANGRRNESDIFVRGFGRQQVPLMVDGVRIYLPADNRLDFARFLTADVAAIQIQKGYASVLDGPGAMGGAINLVTMKPSKPFEAEGAISAAGRGVEGWNAYAIVGSRQPRYYVQGSMAIADRDSWSLSGDYQPTADSLQRSGERLGSDTQDWRANAKFGITPNATDEYTVNYTKQAGEKGAPLNVYNNPPVPPNSYWRWPWWDVQNTSVLTHTQLGVSSYVEGKAYYNTFSNGLDAFDDITYTTQSANGRFHSPYNDHAYGTSLEFGTTPIAANTVKAAFHYRTDVHSERQISRPTQSDLPDGGAGAATGAEHLVAGAGGHGSPDADARRRRRAQLREVPDHQGRGIQRGARQYEYPKGGSDAVNWQGALVWRHAPTGEWHASISGSLAFSRHLRAVQHSLRLCDAQS